MRRTYAATWKDSDGSSESGRLEFGPSALRLHSDGTVRSLPYRDLSDVEIAGDDAEGGELVLRQRAGGAIRIRSDAQAAIVSELAERLAGLVLAQRRTSQVVIVLPVQEAAREQVRKLLATGPPFDLEASGLDRHQVFLTEREAVFLFEASDRSVLERLAADVHLSTAAEAWKEHVAGPARLAEVAYSWMRTDVAEGLSFAATPGPGDSEGGDLYPP